MSLDYLDFVEREQLPKFKNEIDGIKKAEYHLDYINKILRGPDGWSLTKEQLDDLNDQRKVFQQRLDNNALIAKYNKWPSSGGKRHKRSSKRSNKRSSKRSNKRSNKRSGKR